MPRSPNCATPEASDVAVKLPPSVPLPDAMLAVTSTPTAGLPGRVLHLHDRLHHGIERSVSAATGGLVVMTIGPAEPPARVMVLETAETVAAALKRNVYGPAAPEIARSVKVATPTLTRSFFSVPTRPRYRGTEAARRT